MSNKLRLRHLGVGRLRNVRVICTLGVATRKLEKANKHKKKQRRPERGVGAELRDEWATTLAGRSKVYDEQRNKRKKISRNETKGIIAPIDERYGSSVEREGRKPNRINCPLRY